MLTDREPPEARPRGTGLPGTYPVGGLLDGWWLILDSWWLIRTGAAGFGHGQFSGTLPSGWWISRAGGQVLCLGAWGAGWCRYIYIGVTGLGSCGGRSGATIYISCHVESAATDFGRLYRSRDHKNNISGLPAARPSHIAENHVIWSTLGLPPIRAGGERVHGIFHFNWAVGGSTKTVIPL